MPLRGDRIHRYVNAFCPLCHEERPDRPLAEVHRLSGWLVEREGRIWLERGCATHGLVRTLYDESPEILSYLEQWTAPTKVHTPDLAGNFAPVPAAVLLLPRLSRILARISLTSWRRVGKSRALPRIAARTCSNARPTSSLPTNTRALTNA